MHKVIFFDLDDTLLNHSDAVEAGVRAVHAELPIPAPPLQSFLQAWRAVHSVHYPRYLAGELSYDELRRERVRAAVDPRFSDEACDAVFRRYMEAYEAAWRPYSDVFACLSALRGHVKGIITNGPSAEQRAKLERLGVADEFQHILISEECGYAKPDLRIFGLATSVTRLRAEEIVYIGDHYELDVLPARRLGLRAIWLDRSGTAVAAEGAEVVRSLEQFVDLLARG